ncbi:MAG: lipoprotein signal peptidase [Saprospiraceae bacterium]|nr:lipoprotein signal peptidase [Saprospiraceae bacterium]
MKKGYLVALLVFVVLLIDQASKFYVKTHFEYNEDVLMFGQNWARLHFVENEGMAFGITFDWTYGKLVLSLFRILMVAGLILYIRALIAAKVPTGFIMSVGLITAGALGNIIDSAVYGMIFSESPYHGGMAELVPFGEGYGTFLHGKVVDMLYFPMKYFDMPEWLGGGTWLFFSPIFNVADAAITSGVLSILLFQRRFFKDGFVDEKPAAPGAITSDTEPVLENTEATTTESEEVEDVTAAEMPGESADAAADDRRETRL